MLSIRITEQELLRNPVLTGDENILDVKAIMTKLREIDVENLASIEARYDTLESHDHTAEGMKLGSVMPGSTNRADSFVYGAITNPKILNLAVSSVAIKDGEIYGAPIALDTIQKGKIGSAADETITVLKSGSTTVNHGLGYKPMFHVEGAYCMDVLVISVDTNNIVLQLGSGSTVSGADVTVVYR